MKETYQYLAELCSSSVRGPQPLRSLIRNIHSLLLEEKGPAREVPIVGEDSAILLNRLGVSIST